MSDYGDSICEKKGVYALELESNQYNPTQLLILEDFISKSFLLKILAISIHIKNP